MCRLNPTFCVEALKRSKQPETTEEHYANLQFAARSVRLPSKIFVQHQKRILKQTPCSLGLHHFIAFGIFFSTPCIESVFVFD